MFQLQHIDHIAFRVRDVERSAAWYQETLGLERLARTPVGSVPVELVSGNTAVALFPLSPAEAGGTHRLDYFTPWHLAFRTNRDNFEKARVILEQKGIAVEFADHGYSQSIYFYDPDGCRLEFTTYEVGA